MIQIPAQILDLLRDDARRHYPHECCGALLGMDGPQMRRVEQVVPLPNAWPDEPRRYLIEGDAVRSLESRASADGMKLIGFYHSHPDDAPTPSGFDTQHAWPWYSYLIVGVAGRDPGDVHAWRLADDRSAFQAETLIVQEFGGGK